MKLFLPDLFLHHLGCQGSGFWLLVLQRVCLNLLFTKRKFKGFLKGFYDSPLPDNSFWNFFCLLHLFLFFISVSCNAERVQFWFWFWFWIFFLGVFIQSLGFFLSFWWWWWWKDHQIVMGFQFLSSIGCFHQCICSFNVAKLILSQI
jgi:hypothetical protein